MLNRQYFSLSAPFKNIVIWVLPAVDKMVLSPVCNICSFYCAAYSWSVSWLTPVCTILFFSKVSQTLNSCYNLQSSKNCKWTQYHEQLDNIQWTWTNMWVNRLWWMLGWTVDDSPTIDAQCYVALEHPSSSAHSCLGTGIHPIPAVIPTCMSLDYRRKLEKTSGVTGTNGNIIKLDIVSHMTSTIPSYVSLPFPETPRKIEDINAFISCWCLSCKQQVLTHNHWGDMFHPCWTTFPSEWVHFIIIWTAHMLHHYTSVFSFARNGVHILNC